MRTQHLITSIPTVIATLPYNFLAYNITTSSTFVPYIVGYLLDEHDADTYCRVRLGMFLSCLLILPAHLLLFHA